MASLKLYNTLTRGREVFTPHNPSKISMYVCGPTVYDYAHIGNARPVVVFDVLYRLLQHLYGTQAVIYVRNITDIEDKIINAARENGETIAALTARTAQQYMDDMAAIGAMLPTHNPRATEYVPQMVALITTLINKGFAYIAEGHVLFHTQSYADYGQLSGRSRDEQVAGARVEIAPYKRDAADFVLWKPSSEAQPGWDSPWGRGRPGWHIECSAMAEDILGTPLDIHAGGLDLIFPHHENEIAQSCAASGKTQLARYWLHNGFVTVNGEKMSKSLGNFITVHELLAHWPGEVIRYVLLSAHYRQPLDISETLLKQAKAALDRLYRPLREVGDGVAVVDLADLENSGLLDDLNLPQALTYLHHLAGQLNKTPNVQLAGRLQGLGSLLGLLQTAPLEWFQTVGVSQGNLPAAAATHRISEAEIVYMIEQRAQARARKDFTESDRIRDQLKETGIILEDKPDGETVWVRG